MANSLVNRFLFTTAMLLLLSACSMGRLNLGQKHTASDPASLKAVKTEVEVPAAELALCDESIALVATELQVETMSFGSDQSKVPLLEESTPAVNKTFRSKEEKEKKKKRSSIFKPGMQLSGISSGTLALATATFFLRGISIYFPVVGVILLIAGVYFFVRGLNAYRDAKETLQWQPADYAKQQKVGWATTILIINCVMVALAAVGLASIIF